MDKATSLHASTTVADHCIHRAPHIDYETAIIEFDRLWETGRSKAQPEIMRRLLEVIEAHEAGQQP